MSRFSLKLGILLFITLDVLHPYRSWGFSLPGTLYSPDSFERLHSANSRIQNDPTLRNLLRDSKLNSLVISQRIEGPGKIETTQFQHYYQGVEVIGSVAFHHEGPNGFKVRNKTVPL